MEEGFELDRAFIANDDAKGNLKGSETIAWELEATQNYTYFDLQINSKNVLFRTFDPTDDEDYNQIQGALDTIVASVKRLKAKISDARVQGLAAKEQDDAPNVV